MKPGGGSSLYDAVYMACVNRELVKGEPSVLCMCMLLTTPRD